MKTIENPQQIASSIESYLRDRSLYYGAEPRSNGDASWTIALNNHQVTEAQESYLTEDAPLLIVAFHRGSAKLLQNAFDPDRRNGNPVFQRLHNYLTTGVPEETQELWFEAARNKQQIFSTRPDMVIDPSGDFHIIEYNTDGGADKGNTQGVNDYSGLFLGEPVLGNGLAQLFIQQIRERYKNRDKISVATVLPDSYRKEYDAQNIYFAKVASEIGKKYRVEWYSVQLADIQYTDSAVFIAKDGKRIKIDVIDREFKLPGFTSSYDFSAEKRLIKAGFDGQVDILSSVLPFQDKILLSTIFDEPYGTVFNYREDLQKLHSATAVADPNRSFINLGVEQYSVEDVFQLKPQFQMVLKRGGDTDGSTGSKGLVISKDVNPDNWKRALEYALSEPMKGGSFWIIQQFYESASFPVHHIRNSRSKARELTVINRFAPYYINTDDGLQLGNILVTAATDEETNRRRLHNVHGLRHNTYQAVSRG